MPRPTSFGLDVESNAAGDALYEAVVSGEPISYSHDSPFHQERVLALARRLADDGFDCALNSIRTRPRSSGSRTRKRSRRLPGGARTAWPRTPCAFGALMIFRAKSTNRSKVEVEGRGGRCCQVPSHCGAGAKRA